MTNQVSESYLHEHPDEVDRFIKDCFKVFAKDHCVSSLIASLQIIARVKGLSEIAKMNDPRLEQVNTMLQAIGYRLGFEKIEGAGQ